MKTIISMLFKQSSVWEKCFLNWKICRSDRNLMFFLFKKSGSYFYWRLIFSNFFMSDHENKVFNTINKLNNNLVYADDILLLTNSTDEIIIIQVAFRNNPVCGVLLITVARAVESLLSVFCSILHSRLSLKKLFNKKKKKKRERNKFSLLCLR